MSGKEREREGGEREKCILMYLCGEKRRVKRKRKRVSARDKEGRERERERDKDILLYLCGEER